GLGPAFEPVTQHRHVSSTATVRYAAIAALRSLKLCGSELPQHVVQDSSVDEVLLLLGRVDPDSRFELRSCAVRPRRRHAYAGDPLDSEPDDVERLAAVEAEARGRIVAEELQRQHAHADQVRAVYALEALGEDRAHAEQRRALRRPVARGARAVFLAGDHDERRAVLLVAHRGI